MNQNLEGQQQTTGDIQVQGDDNFFNIIQGDAVTLNQTRIIQVLADAIRTHQCIKYYMCSCFY